MERSSSVKKARGCAAKSNIGMDITHNSMNWLQKFTTLSVKGEATTPIWEYKPKKSGKTVAWVIIDQLSSVPPFPEW